MAFIVEMFWGKPDRCVVYGYEEGEFVPVKVIEGPPKSPEEEPHRFFSCSDWTWEDALALGKKFGWKPMGTVPEDEDSEKWEALGPFKNNYEPGDWVHIKRVLAEDAAALADSLTTVHLLLKEGTVALEEGHRPALLMPNMTPEEFEKNNRGITIAFLEEFIAFLRKGTFEFTFDD
jgi:hypothetical protein